MPKNPRVEVRSADFPLGLTPLQGSLTLVKKFPVCANVSPPPSSSLSWVLCKFLCELNFDVTAIAVRVFACVHYLGLPIICLRMSDTSHLVYHGHTHNSHTTRTRCPPCMPRVHPHAITPSSIPSLTYTYSYAHTWPNCCQPPPTQHQACKHVPQAEYRKFHHTSPIFPSPQSLALLQGPQAPALWTTKKPAFARPASATQGLSLTRPLTEGRVEGVPLCSN